MGIKAVGQFDGEYQVHPVQVTQWKGVIRGHLPEFFESPQAASQDSDPHWANYPARNYRIRSP